MKVVSLFSGAGGLDLGFKMAGHDIIWANDMYADAVETYKKNIGDHIICEDISKIKAEDIPDCDIIIGGFPCQGFSVANTKRHEDDERNVLYKQLIRMIDAKRPKFFLAENGSYSGAVEQIVRKLATDSTRKTIWTQLQIDYLKEHLTNKNFVHEISYQYRKGDSYSSVS